MLCYYRVTLSNNYTNQWKAPNNSASSDT